MARDPACGMNVIVHEHSGQSVVAIADPVAMLGIVDNPEVRGVAEEARAKLERVVERLAELAGQVQA